MVFAEHARLTRSGIIIVGSGDSLRAFEPFRGQVDGGLGYADAVNEYKRTFGQDVNVYCMIIPTAVAIYCPDEAKEWTRDQQTTVRNIYAHLHWVLTMLPSSLPQPPICLLPTCQPTRSMSFTTMWAPCIVSHMMLP